MTFVDPNNHRTLNIEPVPFHLLRVASPSAEDLQTNYALARAMRQPTVLQKFKLLHERVERIQASVSAADSFCQNLIRDLQSIVILRTANIVLLITIC